MFHDVTLIYGKKISLHNVFFVKWHVLARLSRSTITFKWIHSPFAGKFAIQRPSSTVYFGVKRGRCSIGIALTKLDFNVLLEFVNSATVVEKSWIICHRISRISWISIRDSYAASVKKERLFSQSKESLQGTTSFNLASQHRSQKHRKLKVHTCLKTLS